MLRFPDTYHRLGFLQNRKGETRRKRQAFMKQLHVYNNKFFQHNLRIFIHQTEAKYFFLKQIIELTILNPLNHNKYKIMSTFLLTRTCFMSTFLLTSTCLMSTFLLTTCSTCFNCFIILSQFTNQIGHVI